MLAEFRVLPRNFVRDVIMNQPSKDIMNMMARCVLNLYSYDPDPDNIMLSNVLRQSLALIAQFPMIAVYSHRAYRYANSNDASLIIHKPISEYSTSQNLLHILRKDSSFTDLEAKVLDICLILHADHGGGNNSTFTTHVVTSSGTDTYSSTVASLGSLKGPKHGGANIKVNQMFDNIKENISDWSERSVRNYVNKILSKKAFDRTGLVYGMGHAVYTISDPRAEVLKVYAGKLAIEKGKEEEFELYNTVAKVASELIQEQRNIDKPVNPNVDFYSGFVYSMLNLPPTLYTPLFAIARIPGWSAHRIEELINGNKIIRPAYHCVQQRRDYIPLNKR
jgi:citrate synthase